MNLGRCEWPNCTCPGAITPAPENYVCKFEDPDKYAAAAYERGRLSTMPRTGPIHLPSVRVDKLG